MQQYSFVLILLTGILVVNSLPRSYEGNTWVKYEAKDGFHVGKMQATSCNTGTNDSSSFVSVHSGSTIIFICNIPRDGVYPVQFVYTQCKESKTDVVSWMISANGYTPLPTQRTSASKGVWNTKSDSIFLRTGLNTIEYQINGSQIAVDFMKVKGALPLALRGATTNYIEYEAEDSTYQGTIIGPDRKFNHLPSEASGRKAVQLTKSGDYVEFTLKQPANAVVIRYSIPDSPTGSGLSALLGLYINGVSFQVLNITSLYSWVYGSYPFSKNPGEGNPHHFYDDIRVKFGKILPAGTKFRVQGTVTTIVYTIDLADFYMIPDPYSPPTGSLNVVDFGADPSGQKDSLNAFKQAISKAQGQNQVVWIPTGTFTISSRLTVNQITIRGAGPWFTELNGPDFGFFGNFAPNPSTSVKIYDLAIFGKTRQRIDSEISSGIGGSLTGSLIQNIWIEHNKCGMWLDGPFSDLMISGVTIRNTFADGINFHKGVSNSIVQQSIIRNTGDDSLAMWPERPDNYGNCSFKFNTLSLPILANTLAIYGGDSNTLSDNICSDTISYGAGIQIGPRFNSVGITGTTIAARNTLIRTGTTGDPGAYFGAIWFYAQIEPMSTPITISDTLIQDSLYSGVTFYSNAVTNVVFSNVSIDGGSFFLQEISTGSATFNNVVATNLAIGGQWNCGVPFQLILGPGNSGWSDKHCVNF